MVNIIKTENLTKVYDHIKAVDSLNLSIEEGTVFGFIGPNGAGKTTTIEMMMGLVEPTDGSCFINDINVTKNPMELKKIAGYLPDNIGFYNNLTGRQNLMFFSQFYLTPSISSNKKIEDLLKYVGLEGFEKPVGNYSRGMRQRLGLAQALLNDPDVIFLDEPTNGLDPQGVIQLRKVIRELSDNGKIIFYSSHILNEVKNICKAVGIISKGKLIAYGTTAEIQRELQMNDLINIRVQASGTIPRFTNDNVIDIKYSGDRAFVYASTDIRKELSQHLIRNNLDVIEMVVEETPLEDLFIKVTYGGE